MSNSLTTPSLSQITPAESPETFIPPAGGRLRWVNDWPAENFQAKIAKGYLIVELDGVPVSSPAGTRPDGSQGRRYLMQAPLAIERKPVSVAFLEFADIIDSVAQEISGTLPAPPLVE